MDDFFTSTDTDAPAALLAGSHGSEPDARQAAELDPHAGLTPDELFALLHREHAQRLFRFALSMLHCREDAEDAVQVVFMNAYSSIVDGRVPRQEVSWLFRITRNVCLNRIRTSQRKPAGTLDGIDVASLRTVDDALDQRLHSRALRTALERLPEQQRKAIVLRELQGASYAEIADALDTTHGAVESLVFRARRQLAIAMRAMPAGPGLAPAAAAA